MAEARASQDGSSPPERSARDSILQAIVRGLYDGRYSPGQRLQEAQLTATYGTSRGPVREALNALAAMGIVDLSPQRGAQVRILRIKEAIDTLIVAQTLIGLSARLAAANCHDNLLRQRLQDAIDAIMAFGPDAGGAAFAIARDAFYSAINAMAGNAELSRLLPTVRIHLIRVQFRAILHSDLSRRRAEYRRIAAAILNGRPGEAENAARAHLGRALSQLKDFENRPQASQSASD